MRGVRRRVLRSGGWLPANSPQSLHEQVHRQPLPPRLDVLDRVTLGTAGIDDRLVAPGTLTPQFKVPPPSWTRSEQ